MNWCDFLSVDPTPALLDQEDGAIKYFVKRDLVGEQVPSVEDLWDLSETQHLLAKQRADGSWKYPGSTKKYEDQQNYALLETFRNLRILVDKYEFTREQSAIQDAASYVFSCQTEEGDIRGILGNQYMPYYHGAILGLLVEAGYLEDEEIRLGLDWLLFMRQEDGGWLIPAQTVPSKERTSEFWIGSPIPPDRSQPLSHLATGMALRAFSAHPDYRQLPEVSAAGNALKSRFFKPDKYNDRKATSYWFKFQFPFWWNNLLTALDTLAKLGFTREDPEIAAGLDWFIQNQEVSGLWSTGYGSGNKDKAAENQRWVGLAICRVMKQYYGDV